MLYAVFSTAVQSWCCRRQPGCSFGGHLQFPLQTPTTVDYRWVYLGCSIISKKKLTKWTDNKAFLYPNFGSRSLDNSDKYIPERFSLGIAAPNVILLGIVIRRPKIEGAEAKIETRRWTAKEGWWLGVRVSTRERMRIRYIPWFSRSLGRLLRIVTI